MAYVFMFVSIIYFCGTNHFQMEWLRITTDALPTISGAKIWPGPACTAFLSSSRCWLGQLSWFWRI